ncbi:MAG: PQQ-binding-like beta-propeller repeat protein [Candidatus Latescibacteria bacterium]|nr:PQQ-binding-like beta-propeller repeat protein [Candidatus Latescibacterota bacterium]
MKKILFLVPVFVLVFMGCPSNKAPLTPERPVGPRVAIPNFPDTFAVVTTDPNDDDISYRFNWGNGIISEWSEFKPSGDTYYTTYTYQIDGNYQVTCQAKDQKGKTSGWSEYLLVRCGLGRIRWAFTCPDEAFFNSTAAIDDNGNIYAGCEYGHLHSIGANGAERQGWPFVSSTQDEFISSPAIAPNGTIYACDRGGNIYALTANKNILWSKFVNEEIIASPAVGRNSEIYINTLDGLYAFSASGGQMWRNESIVGVSSVTIDQNNYLYVGTEDDYFYCLDTAGNIRWQYLVDDEIISSPVAMPNNRVCVGCIDGRIYIFQPDSGFIIRTSSYGTISSTPAIGTDGSIYLTTEEGVLAKLFPDGDYEWSFSTDGYNCSSPAIVRYAGVNQDIVYFSTTWGKKKRSDEDLDSLYMIKEDGTRFGACAIPQGYPSDEGFISSPMITVDGTIIIGGGIDDNDIGGLFALTGKGLLANSTWPLFRRDRKNSGRMQ